MRIGTRTVRTRFVGSALDADAETLTGRTTAGRHVGPGHGNRAHRKAVVVHFGRRTVGPVRAVRAVRRRRLRFVVGRVVRRGHVVVGPAEHFQHLFRADRSLFAASAARTAGVVGTVVAAASGACVPTTKRNQNE